MQSKEERKEYEKRYRAEHKEKIKERDKQYHAEHKKEAKEYEKQYRAEHKEKIKEWKKQYNANRIEENKEYGKQYRVKNKERIKQYNNNHKKEEKIRHLRNKYNITPEQYNELFNKQNGKCMICKKHQSELKKLLGVDHNHKTGKVRGLLCDNCNKGIGLLKEDINILINAINYLKDNE